MPAERVELETALEQFDRLLLDTCVLIDEFKKPSGRLGVINRPQRATSVVALWEFLHVAKGVLLPEAERRDRRAWLTDQEIVALPLNDGVGQPFEELLETEGPSNVGDAVLAAQCLSERCPIVTSNVKDFKDVLGLHYIEW